MDRIESVYIRPMIGLQKHTKVFRYIKAYEGDFLKYILTYYYALNIIKLTNVQNNVSYTGSHK